MNRPAFLCALVALLLCAMMPGTQSLWMDEYESWRVASLPTLAAMWADLNANSASEALMPLGMVNEWLALRVFGSGEWAFRAVNILWAAATVGAFAALGVRWRAPWAPLLVAVQPFLWYYGNEARPYTMQIACAAGLLWGVVVALEEQRLRGRILALLLVSGGVLVGTTLFGILTVGPAFLALGWIAWRKQWVLPRGWGLWLGIAGLWAALLGGYYLLALKRGAGGVKLWDVGLQNIGFALYEFAGFTGFGPGRSELREAAMAGGARAALGAFGAGLLPIALLGAGYAGLVAALARRTLGSPARLQVLVVGGIAAVSAGCLIALALFVRFPFWGRHLAPVFPFFCALVVLAVRSLVEAPSRAPARVGALVFGLLLFSSSLLLRFSPRHGRDDYRGAVALARTLAGAGHIIWWAADVRTARYYRLQVQNAVALDGRMHHVSGLTAEELAARPEPTVIFVSKPDAYDPGRVVTTYAAERGYRTTQRLNAFRVLERP